MSYKIIKDEKKFYQVMHPDGSKFTVPKNGLSKDVMEKISKYPKMYDGGPIAINSNPTIPENLATEQYTPPQPDPGPSPFLMGSDRPEPTEHFVEGQGVVPINQTPVAPPDQVGQQMQQPVVQDQQILQQDNTMNDLMKPYDQMSSNAMAGANKLKQSETDFNRRLDENSQRQQQDAQDFAKFAQENNDRYQQQAAEKIDQGHFWGSMNTGNKILAGIAVALGGIGSGLTGKPNAALEAINKSIDNDINLQKENKNSLLNSYMQQFKNKEMAYAATKLALVNQADNIAKKYSASVKTAEGQQAASQFQAQIDLQKKALSAQLLAQTGNQFLLKKATEGDLQPEQIAQLPKEQRELYVHGAGLATNPEGARKVRTTQANKNDIENILDRISQIKTKYGREVFNSPASTEAESLGQQLIGKLREPILGPGTVNESEYKRLQSVIPSNVTEIFSYAPNQQAKLDTLRTSINNNYENQLKSEGMRVLPRPKPASMGRLSLNK